ncbi:MAG: O-acetyl-ADP-ribose deacetylase [Chitinivibrionia bacterium]|nr:O-acetyl-ADP-ribose deacetylase [Chitinivibrionia bacterium]
MEKRYTVGKTAIRLVKGDITKQDTAAIVNAANSSLMGGGGVDGAIHRAGGPQILDECRRIAASIGSLPPGDAVIATGGNLQARFVIHTVGPIWQGGGKNEARTLEKAYYNSLSLALEKELATISFPSISTGAYRFPLEQAAHIAAATVVRFAKENPLEEVRFVLFSEEDFAAYDTAVASLCTG